MPHPRPASPPGSAARVRSGSSLVSLAAHSLAPSLSRHVYEAGLLRKLALKLLGGRPAPEVEEWVRRARSASPFAWSCFLASERCAVALNTRLLNVGVRDALRPETLAVLDSFRRRELQRMLAARGQLQALGRSAEERGERVIVLKGGVPIAAGATGPAHGSVDLSDLDLLPETGRERRFQQAIRHSGYEPKKRDGAYHFAPLAAPRLLPIEVHHRVREIEARRLAAFRSRARPTELPGIFQFAPPDQLWHLLVHAGIHHPARRSALRDWLLIRDAAAGCTPGELAVVRKEISRRAQGLLLGRLLDAALTIPGPEGQTLGTEARDPDEVDGPFRWIASGNYASAAVLIPAGPPAWLAIPVQQTVTALLSGRQEYVGQWTRVGAQAGVSSDWRILARVQGVSRRGGRLAVTAARALRLAAATGLAAIVVLRVHQALGRGTEARRGV